MSSGSNPQVVAEKVDVRKYLQIFLRRKWWGVVPFTLLVLLTGVICFAVPWKYRSSCVIRASKSEVATILEGGGSTVKTSEEIVREEMLWPERMRVALSKTDIMKELERKSAGSLDLRGRLEEELFQRVIKNTQIGSVGKTFISVSYLGNTEEEAFDVLQGLAQNFVEQALKAEREDARQAQDLAQRELTLAQNGLEELEKQIVTFREERPGVMGQGEGSKQEALRAANRELEVTERSINASRSRLEKYREQLENMPKQTVDTVKTTPNPEIRVYQMQLAELRTQLAMALKTYTRLHPLVKQLEQQIQVVEEQFARAQEAASQDEVSLKNNEFRDKLEEKKLELEAFLDYQIETQRNLQDRTRRLEQEAKALPGLERLLGQLERDRATAAARYAEALKQYKRVAQELTIKMAGLVSFSIVSPARKPRTPDLRHIYRLAVMGLFVSLVVGVGAVAGTEFFDQSFTDVEVARDYLRLPSLGVIPVIETAIDRRRRQVRLVAAISVSAAVLTALAVAVLWVAPVHNLARDLWSMIQDLCKNLV